MSLGPSQNALFVERIDGPLNDITPTLRRLGFDVVRASDADAIAKLLKTLRRLSLIVVNGDTLKTDATSLVGKIKGQHPDLPMIWFSKGTAATRPAGANIALVTSDPAQITDWLKRRMCEELYSPSFIRQVLGGFGGVLGNFSLPTRPNEPGLKSTMTTLGEVNAFLFITGGGIGGHLILSASTDALSLAYRTQFKRNRFPELDELEDLLGEAASQMIGFVRRSIRSEECQVGLPQFIRGAGAMFRHKAGVPSLQIEFSNHEQSVKIELCVYRLDGTALCMTESPLQTGVVNLL